MAASWNTCIRTVFSGLLYLLAICILAANGDSSYEDQNDAHAQGTSNDNYMSNEATVGVRFDVEPIDTVVQRGQDATFNCAVSETPSRRKPGQSSSTVNVTWRKVGEPFLISGNGRRGSNGGGGSRKMVLSDGSLRIERVQSRADVGEYECLATGSYGVLVSRRASLDIAELGRFTSHPQHVSVLEGQTARFQCAIQGTPTPVIMWEKNGEPIETSDRFVVLPSGVLHIEIVQSHDAGNYRCRAVNIARERHSNNATLQVAAAPGDATSDDMQPQLIVGPEDMEAVAGESVVLECPAVSYSLPRASNIIWQRLDGKPIPASRSRSLGRGNLEIRNISLDDEGMYRCMFANFADVWAEAVVSVIVPPRVIQELRNLIRPRSGNVRMSCNVTGRPTPDITWLKDGNQIVESDEHVRMRGNVLSIAQSTDTDAGIYQCWGSNVAGRMGTSMYLSIDVMDDAPDPPTGLRAIATSSRAIELSWNKSLPKNGQPIVAYAINYRANRAGAVVLQSVVQETRARLEPLLPYTNYSFYVVAYSDRSPSNRSAVITQRTEEDVPNAVPVVKLSPDSATSLRVSWNPLPSDRARGVLTQHQIIYRRQHSNEQEVIEVDGDVYEHVITGLESGVRYEVMVVSGTLSGFPPVDDNWPWYPMALGEVRPPDVGTVQMASVVVRGPSVVELKWNPVSASSVRDAELLGFKIAYRAEGEPSLRTIIVVPENTEHTITHLEPDTSYEISLWIFTDISDGPPVSWVVRTLPSVNEPSPDPVTLPPSPRLPHPPSELQVETLNETAIRLMWKKPHPVGSKDDVSSYNVSFWPLKSDAQPEEFFFRESNARFITSWDTRIVIGGLRPYSSYYFTVCSCTSETRCGAFSPEKIGRTAEGRPSSPRDIKVVLVSAVDVYVSWQPPLELNGVISSYVLSVCEHRFDSSSATLSTSEPCSRLLENGTSNHTILRSLRPGTTYRIFIHAVTTRGDGPATSIALITTRWDYPEPPKGDTNNDRLMGIVIGVSISGCCIIICIVIILLRNRCMPAASRSDCSQCCAPPGHHHHFHSNGCVCRETPVLHDDSVTASLNRNHCTHQLTHVDSKSCIQNGCCRPSNYISGHDVPRMVNGVCNSYLQSDDRSASCLKLDMSCNCARQTALIRNGVSHDHHNNQNNHQTVALCQDIQSNDDTDVDGSASLNSVNT